MLGCLEKWNFSSPFESDAQDETIHSPEPYSNRPIHHAKPHFFQQNHCERISSRKKSAPRRISPDKKDEKLVA